MVRLMFHNFLRKSIVISLYEKFLAAIAVSIARACTEMGGNKILSWVEFYALKLEGYEKNLESIFYCTYHLCHWINSCIDHQKTAGEDH